MLKIKDLNVYYGGLHALKEVSLNVKKGEIVALIGRNGAGKTTLLNTISGLIKPKSGSIKFMDKEITNLKPASIVNLGLYQVPEGRLIFSPLTVKENLELGAYLTGGKISSNAREKMESVFRLFPILKERLNQRAGTLSGGEQQMLAIARALMGKAKFLALDEPSLGLAPIVAREIFHVLLKLKKEGVTILLVEQNAKAALSIADRAYVLDAGRVILEGEAKVLLGTEEIKDAYLGEQRGWDMKKLND